MPSVLKTGRKRDFAVYTFDDNDDIGAAEPDLATLREMFSSQPSAEPGETIICIGSSGDDGRLTRTKLAIDIESIQPSPVGFDTFDTTTIGSGYDEEYPEPSDVHDTDEGPPIRLPPAPSLTPYENGKWSFNHSVLDDDDDEDQEAELDDTPVAEPQSKPSSSTPQQEWTRLYREAYLREMIWLEGQGARRQQTCCNGCGGKGPTSYRCKSCIGTEPLCRACIVEKHRFNPFHFIERWNGSHYESTTLKQLGLSIQLGHPPGHKCANPEPSRHDDFVVVDTTGIHEVSLLFCRCDGMKEHFVQLLRYGLFPGTGMEPRTAATFRALKFFQIMSFESKGSHEEFYKAISRLSGNVKIKPSRDRYHEFMVMVSQWRHLKMLKRAGRGHDQGGVAGTQQGSCAVRCPACPQPGINLPSDWASAPPGKRWIYRLFVSVDGNFRLKRRLVSSDEKDPGLNDGWAYFVENTGFKEHLAKEWGTQQDRSTCVAHDAVDKPDRQARGLAASGVAAVVCTRHEFRLPNSVGDLQKGERYINIDYIAFSAIRWFKILELVFSYDIGCQYHKKLFERLMKLPSELRPIHLAAFIVLIPKFHLPAHIEYCNRTYSFNLTPGVGRTDGEAPERGWSRLNAVAKSTAEMGPGNRRDTVDDHMADENWEKTKKTPATFVVKMERAIEGRAKHTLGLEEYRENIPDKFIKLWIERVEQWEADPSNNPNPFEVETTGISEQAVRLQLAEEAEAANRAMRAKDDGDDDEDEGEGAEGTKKVEDAGVMHPSLFISAGIQLEEDQRKLHISASELGNHPTKKQLTNMVERSNTLRRRIAVWMEVQKLYIPEVESLRRRQDSESTDVDGKPATEAYEIPLLLPSSLPKNTCTPNLIDYEAKLREGQAYDALNEIRRYLRLRSYLYKRKDANARGVAANTRSNVAIQRAQKGVDNAALKYTRAYTALITLHGERTEVNEDGEQEQWRRDLRVLKSVHLRGLSEGLYGETEGKREISWIWKSRLAPSTPESEESVEKDEQLQDALRIEFLKARARAKRWEEEVVLLEEEMRRTLQFFRYKAEWWFSRQGSTIGGSTYDYVEGFSAYALSQCSVYHTLFKECEQRWAAGRERNWVKKVQKGGRKKRVTEDDAE